MIFLIIFLLLLTYAKKYKPKIRCFKNFDLSSFLKFVSIDLYSPNLTSNNNDINITCETLISMFIIIVDQHAAYQFASGEETLSTNCG